MIQSVSTTHWFFYTWGFTNKSINLIFPNEESPSNDEGYHIYLLILSLQAKATQVFHPSSWYEFKFLQQLKKKRENVLQFTLSSMKFNIRIMHIHQKRMWNYYPFNFSNLRREYLVILRVDCHKCQGKLVTYVLLWMNGEQTRVVKDSLKHKRLPLWPQFYFFDTKATLFHLSIPFSF